MEEIMVLYQDENIVVCRKFAGVLSQSGKPGERSMVTLLEAQLGSEIFPVHRLDKEVGGVMVYARNQRTAAALSRQIQQGTMQKEYLAVVRGCPETSAGQWTDLLYHDKTRNKTYVVKRNRKGVREAKLLYRVLETAEERSLVQIHLLTGRTHQIRVQFASRGLPLEGDGKYGGGSGKVQLWSVSLCFSVPGKGQQRFTVSPDMLGPFRDLAVPESLK